MPAISDPPPAIAPVCHVRGVHRRHHRLRRLFYLSAGLAVLACTVLLGTGWYFSSQLLDVTHTPDAYSARVLAVSRNSIELTRTASTAQPGLYALAWRGGRALVGAVTALHRSDVVRRFSGNTDSLKIGTPVRIDIWVYRSPADLHLRYRTVNIPDALGPMPAWYIPGRRDTWVIIVHGYKSNRVEGLRPLATLTSLGFPVLDLSYRNDLGAPASSDHLYHLGASEWLDLQAGVRYAIVHGAHSVILYGYSMGGAIVEYFLGHSIYAGKVRAVVLDSPVLDWGAALDLQARERGLPNILTVVGMQIVAHRIGLTSLQPLNAIRNAAHLHAPTLLIQGTADTMVPVAPSAVFARALPRLVTYVVVPGAEHTQAWNVNPAAYASRLKAFLGRIVR